MADVMPDVPSLQMKAYQAHPIGINEVNRWQNDSENLWHMPVAHTQAMLSACRLHTRERHASQQCKPLLITLVLLTSA